MSDSVARTEILSLSRITEKTKGVGKCEAILIAEDMLVVPLANAS